MSTPCARHLAFVLTAGLLLCGCQRHYSVAECERVVQARQLMASAFSEAPVPSSGWHDYAMKACRKEPRDRMFASCLKLANGEPKDVSRCLSEKMNRR